MYLLRQKFSPWKKCTFWLKRMAHAWEDVPSATKVWPGMPRERLVKTPHRVPERSGKTPQAVTRKNVWATCPTVNNFESHRVLTFTLHYAWLCGCITRTNIVFVFYVYVTEKYCVSDCAYLSNNFYYTWL